MAPWDPGAGKCLRDWITGPGADPCPAKIPKAEQTRLRRRCGIWAFATWRRSAGESLGQSPREGSFCVCCAGPKEGSQGCWDQCPVLTLSVPRHYLAPNLLDIGGSFSQLLPVPSQTKRENKIQPNTPAGKFCHPVEGSLVQWVSSRGHIRIT